MTALIVPAAEGFRAGMRDQRRERFRRPMRNKFGVRVYDTGSIGGMGPEVRVVALVLLLDLLSMGKGVDRWGGIGIMEAPGYRLLRFSVPGWTLQCPAKDSLNCCRCSWWAKSDWGNRGDQVEII